MAHEPREQPSLYPGYRQPSTAADVSARTPMLIKDFEGRASPSNMILKGHVTIDKRSHGNASDSAKAKGCGVHCECFLLQQFASDMSAFRYIGVSKLSCYACENFFQAYTSTFGSSRAFYTKGCHGKLYPKWVAPHLTSAQDDKQLRTNLATQLMTTLSNYVKLPQEKDRFKFRIASDSTNITMPDV